MSLRTRSVGIGRSGFFWDGLGLKGADQEPVLCETGDFQTIPPRFLWMTMLCPLSSARGRSSGLRGSA